MLSSFDSYDNVASACPENTSVSNETHQPSPHSSDETSPEEAPSKYERPSYGGNSCLKLYLTEIGKVKLLTPQQEIELAARIKTGDSKAREEMIKANLRLVVKIARDYENLGVPLMDLISEGNIGLMKAVERFDPAKGAKLSTYSAWWIKQHIKRALANQSKTIRLPVHMVQKISNLNRTARRLHEVLGREPTDEEIADELGTSALCVAEMRVANNQPLSLDSPIGGGGQVNTFAEVIEDRNAESPLARLESKAVTRILREIMDTLSPREASILQARFGLDGSQPKCLDEVGSLFGITRERVRQLQNKALRKLRALLEKHEIPAPTAA
jgi:RNA polymerase primary sigma factor